MLSNLAKRALERDGLADLRDKVLAHERLSEADALRLLEAKDLAALGALANHLREERHGDLTFYNRNAHLNFTNVCVASCKFCSFARPDDRTASEGYTMSLDEAVNQVLAKRHLGLTEVHILKDAGVDTLPGGGAEIFASRVRRKLCDDKATAEQWLEVHRVAHRLGMKTNATMLYGTIETLEERVDHMARLRALQDETGGFQVFIPLAFHPEHNMIGKAFPKPTGYDGLRTYAVARLFLDNFDHLKAYWVMIGERLAQASLSFGVDDLDGTVLEERIYHMAGAETPQALSEPQLHRLIRSAGRTPAERDSVYRVLRVHDGAARA
jgi:aminodeoxyfutalosine synthase